MHFRLALRLHVDPPRLRFQCNELVGRNLANHDHSAEPEGFLHDSSCGCSPVGVPHVFNGTNWWGVFWSTIMILQCQTDYCNTRPLAAVPLVFLYDVVRLVHRWLFCSQNSSPDKIMPSALPISSGGTRTLSLSPGGTLRAFQFELDFAAGP